MEAFINGTLKTFELVAAAIDELRQRVSALEARAVEPLPEQDRSHHVAVGASASSSHSGV